MVIELSNYRIEEQIGEGGMATVYRAVQKSLQRPVALKVLNPLHSNTALFTQRFLNEGRMVAALSHSNIVTIHDIGVEAGLHFIAMELLTGGDLRQRIRQGLSVDTALRYLETIAGALDAAHRQDIVHRDVKPTNVLFRGDGTLVLSDFGIAKRLGGDDLTVTGSTIGSPHYLSPEQARGQPVDARADIYSLGVLLFEMLTRRKPYKGASDIDTVLMHISEPVPSLPAEFTALQPLIDRMLAKAPADRFPGAAAVIAALRPARAAWHAGHGDQTPATDSDAIENTNTVDLGFHEAPTVEREPAAGAGESDFHEAVTIERTPAAEAAGTDVDDAVVIEKTPGADSPPSERDDALAAVSPSAVRDDPAGSARAATARPVLAPRKRGRVAAAALLIGLMVSGVVLVLRDSGPAPGEPPPGEVTGAASAPVAEPGPANRAPSQTPTGTPTPSSPAAPRAVAGGAPQTDATTPPPAPATAIAPGQSAITERDARVADLLAAADAAMADFRLTLPAGDNALEYIGQALTLDPHSGAARAAFARIAERYVVLARSSIAKGETDKARLYVARGLEVNPDNADLQALDTELGPAPAGAGAAGGQPATGETRRGVQGETPSELFDRVKRFLTE